MIIVHENKEILTHNSRRFLVVCNFPPETYTLKASVEVPPHLLKRSKKPHAVSEDTIFSGSRTRISSSSSSSSSDTDPNHISSVYDTYKVNNVRDSRILALHQEHKLVNSSVARTGCKSTVSCTHSKAQSMCLLFLQMHFFKSLGSFVTIINNSLT